MFIVIFISILIDLLHQSSLGCSLRFLDDCTTRAFLHLITFSNQKNKFELPGFGASGKWFIAIDILSLTHVFFFGWRLEQVCVRLPLTLRGPMGGGGGGVKMNP